MGTPTTTTIPLPLLFTYKHHACSLARSEDAAAAADEEDSRRRALDSRPAAPTTSVEVEVEVGGGILSRRSKMARGKECSYR